MTENKLLMRDRVRCFSGCPNFPTYITVIDIHDSGIFTEITRPALVTIQLKAILAIHFHSTSLSGKDRGQSRDNGSSVVVACSIYTSSSVSANESQSSPGESMKI